MAQLVTILFLAALIGLQWWTQWQAAHYGYHPALGLPLWQGKLFMRPALVYRPWDGLVWAWQWGDPWLRVWVIVGAVGVMVALVGILWLRAHWRAGQPPPMAGHGTTQWASRKDVKKAGLF